MDEYVIGEDILLQLTWLDTAGSPLAPSALVDYEVHLFSKQDNETALVVFAKDETGDEQPVLVDDDANGLVSILIPRAITADAPKGECYLNVHRWFADANAVDSKRLEVVKVDAFELIEP